MAIKVLVVDDEPLARERIRTLLASEADFEIVAECANGLEAVEAIKELGVDVVFLDIQMPEMDGFAVLEQLEVDELPLVVFVTAHDDYALKAFDVHALDFLLKPFDRERFLATLARVRGHIARGNADLADHAQVRERVMALLEQLPSRQRFRDRIVVKSEGRVIFIGVDEIDWIEAAGNYARLHVAGDGHLIRETMIGLERKLDPQKYVRIHRSAIVNVGRIREMQPLFHGEYLVVLDSGAQLTLSRGYRENLQKILGDTL